MCIKKKNIYIYDVSVFCISKLCIYKYICIRICIYAYSEVCFDLVKLVVRLVL